MVNKVAVIILNYNSSDDCRKCISFLKRQKGVELELVLVDNCSPDSDIVEALCREQGCTFIASSENRGYNAGNNIGLRYAAEQGYKYALIANPDMEFPQVDYVKRLVETMSIDSKIVLVGTDIVTPLGKHQNPMREMTYCEELFWPITMLHYRKSGKWFLEDYTRSGYCQKLSGCCFLISLSFVNLIDYFDENTFLYSEEPILAKQVRNSGNKMYYLADVQAVHNHVKDKKGNPYRRMNIMCTSRWYYLEKYSGYSKCMLYLLRGSKNIESFLFKFYFKLCGTKIE